MSWQFVCVCVCVCPCVCVCLVSFQMTFDLSYLRYLVRIGIAIKKKYSGLCCQCIN